MTNRIELFEPGSLFDGRFGNSFTTARVVALAAEHGMTISRTEWDRTDRVLTASLSESELTEPEWEPFTELGFQAEEFLNSIAPRDHHFGFSEGDFMYMPAEWWEEEG